MEAVVDEPLVRPARDEDEDEAVALLLASGGAIYPRFAGSVEAAREILRAAYRRRGNAASAEVVWVAEIDGRVAGAMAAFPVAEGADRARRYMSLALLRLPPWRWRRAWRIFGALRPTPPAGALYIDSLATAERARRRGVACALLAAAERDARRRGCSHLALETEVENAPARALYRRFGFEQTGRLPPVQPDLGEGYVCLTKRL